MQNLSFAARGLIRLRGGRRALHAGARPSRRIGRETGPLWRRLWGGEATATARTYVITGEILLLN